MKTMHSAKELYGALLGLTVFGDDYQQMILEDTASHAKAGNRPDIGELAAVLATALRLDAEAVRTTYTRGHRILD